MEVGNGFLKTCFLYNRVTCHFHDYERKGIGKDWFMRRSVSLFCAKLSVLRQTRKLGAMLSQEQYEAAVVLCGEKPMFSKTCFF